MSATEGGNGEGEGGGDTSGGGTGSGGGGKRVAVKSVRFQTKLTFYFESELHYTLR
jgi:hypothetical protein